MNEPTVPTIPELDALEVLVVVDNFYDCFQKEEKCARRHHCFQGDDLDWARLQAEMGLAYLITATLAGQQHVVLLDFGLSSTVYANNVKRLELEIAKAEALVLSHGHGDHYGGLSVALEQAHAPFYVGGTEAFLQRFTVTPARTLNMGILDRALIEKTNEVIIAPRPELVAGVALTTGEIPRLTDYEHVPAGLKMEKDGVLVSDSRTHEHALLLRVRDRGLVVLTSCAHAGVVNTVEHAKRITGENRVLAIIGGMHLTTAEDDVIDKTMAALRTIGATFIAPMHCTGNRAMFALATQLSDAYVHPSVGTRFVFAAEEPARAT